MSWFLILCISLGLTLNAKAEQGDNKIYCIKPEQRAEFDAKLQRELKLDSYKKLAIDISNRITANQSQYNKINSLKHENKVTEDAIQETIYGSLEQQQLEVALQQNLKNLKAVYSTVLKSFNLRVVNGENLTEDGMAYQDPYSTDRLLIFFVESSSPVVMFSVQSKKDHETILAPEFIDIYGHLPTNILEMYVRVHGKKIRTAIYDPNMSPSDTSFMGYGNIRACQDNSTRLTTKNPKQDLWTSF